MGSSSSITESNWVEPPMQNSQEAKKKQKIQIIQKIALHSLAELVVSAVLTGITACFIATPVGIATAAAGAGILFIINIIFRSNVGRLHYKLSQVEDPESKRAVELRKKIRHLNYFCPIFFSTQATATATTLIHEGGHAAAAALLFKNSQPAVEVTPFGGGATTYSVGQLSRLGEKLGQVRSLLVISAAGPAAAVLASTAALGISHKIRHHHPETSRYLKVSAIMGIAHHVFYALSALWEPVVSKRHDFARLALGGIHPIASVAAIVALPLIVKGAFLVADKIKEKRAAAKRAAGELNRLTECAS